MAGKGRPPGLPKVGGRKKGSKNKIVPEKLQATSMAKKLAELDAQGKPMALIMFEAARYAGELAAAQRARVEQVAVETQRLTDTLGVSIDQIDSMRAALERAQDRAAKLGDCAAKIAKDAAAYLYPTHASIKHSGDEEGAPIRIESLSDQQLEKLIERLRRGSRC
jgi:hypothetical protein